MKHSLIALKDRQEAGRLVAVAAALTRGGGEVGAEVVQVLEPGPPRRSPIRTGLRLSL